MIDIFLQNVWVEKTKCQLVEQLGRFVQLNITLTFVSKQETLS